MTGRRGLGREFECIIALSAGLLLFSCSSGLDQLEDRGGAGRDGSAGSDLADGGLDAAAPDASAEGFDVGGMADVVGLADVVEPEDAGVPPGCGNGVIDPGEDCDDLNQSSGDGCDEVCAREIQVRSFSATRCTPMVEHGTWSGGALGGIAVSPTRLFYNGRTAVLFDLPNLSSPRQVPNRIPPVPRHYDGLFADLRTKRVFAPAFQGAPIDAATRPVIIDQLLEVDGASGALASTPTVLSRSVRLDAPELGVYAGWGYGIVESGTVAARIALPSGRVEDLGPIVPINGGDVPCGVAGIVTGIAERFGGRDYVVSAAHPTYEAAEIKRHRLPDGATSVIATFENLGTMCDLTLDASGPTPRWYFETDRSQFGEQSEAVGACDAELGVGGGDGIIAFPGVIKRPFPQDDSGWQSLSPSRLPVMANSFVVPSGFSRVDALGTWLDDLGSGGFPVALQVWADDGAGLPDPAHVLVSTPDFEPITAGQTYFEVDVATSSLAASFTAGTRYWFIVTGLNRPDTGFFKLFRHPQNSDGLVDGGRFYFSGTSGEDFLPGDPERGEMALVVRMSP